jgi:hypothetical protein
MDQADRLQLCRNEILRDLGKLDDISYELANTVANIYYQFLTQRPTASAGDPMSGLAEEARVQTNYQIAPKMIEQVRNLRSQGNPALADEAEELFISLLKYNVKFDDEKSLFQLKAERQLNRHQVHEIEGLVDTLNLR